MRGKAIILSAALLGAATTSAAAQVTKQPDLNYRREVFQYRRDGRSDPFRSLARASDLGVRIEDLSLLGVVYESSGGSVAVLSRGASTKPLRVRLGQAVGGVRVVAIRPRSVDVMVEDFGVARRETIQLRANERKGAR
jgi:hypothetical protein